MHLARQVPRIRQATHRLSKQPDPTLQALETKTKSLGNDADRWLPFHINKVRAKEVAGHRDLLVHVQATTQNGTCYHKYRIPSACGDGELQSP